MPKPVEQFPIIAARSYVGGAIGCLSIADACEDRDPRRADLMLEEALAGLDAARDQIRAAQASRAAPPRIQPCLRRRPRGRRPDVAAAGGPSVVNGVHLFVLVAGALAVLSIPFRKR